MTDDYWYQTTGPSPRSTERPDLSTILPGLTIGEYPTPEDVHWLHDAHGITAVISLQDDADVASKGLDLRTLRQTYERYGVRFERVPVTDGDSETLRSHLDALVTLLGDLLDAGQTVYLHCNAGMNRAPTVAIAYLHERRGLSLREARDFVRGRRFCVPYMRALEEHYDSVGETT